MYYAQIKHHSLSRSLIVEAGESLTAAKRQATRQFGHWGSKGLLCVTDDQGRIVATRGLGTSDRWFNNQI